MKGNLKMFAQSCDSRSCNKKFKEQKSKLCDAITTTHTFNNETKEIICLDCGKVTKLSS